MKPEENNLPEIKEELHDKIAELGQAYGKKAKRTLLPIVITFVLTVILFLYIGMSCNAKKAEEASAEPIPTATVNEPIISKEIVASKLNTVSELCTARLTYNGLIRYEEGKIPLITKKAFFMVYQAEVKAGVDLSLAKVTIEEKTIKIKLPSSMIQDLYIVQDSIQFYDEKTALFNASDRDDALDALKEAEKHVRENASLSELMDEAETQAELIVKGLFSDLNGEYTIVIE